MRVPIGAVAVVVMAMVCGRVGAEPSSRDQARELAGKGLDALDAGDYATAVAHLERAEKLFHAITHLLYMARAQDKLGKLALAHQLYMLVLAEKLTNYAPEVFRDAQKSAHAEVDALRRRIPTVNVSAPTGAKVVIDARPLPAEAIGKPYALSAGTHIVSAMGEDGRRVSR